MMETAVKNRTLVVEVASLLGRDSGKTALMCGLICYLQHSGRTVRAFKPISGSAWNAPNFVTDGYNGNDVTAYLEHLDRQQPRTLLGPLELVRSGKVWMPVVEKLAGEGSKVGFLLIRLTDWDDGPRNIIAWNADLSPREILGDDLQRMREVIHEEHFLTSNDEAAAFVKRLSARSIGAAFRRLLDERPDYLLVESHGAIAHTWDGIDEVDWVFVLQEPRQLAIYSGAEYVPFVRARRVCLKKPRRASWYANLMDFLDKRNSAVGGVRVSAGESLRDLSPIAIIDIPAFRGNVVDGFANLLAASLPSLDLQEGNRGHEG